MSMTLTLRCKDMSAIDDELCTRGSTRNSVSSCKRQEGRLETSLMDYLSTP